VAEGSQFLIYTYFFVSWTTEGELTSKKFIKREGKLHMRQRGVPNRLPRIDKV
jgi:hypothetical protein